METGLFLLLHCCVLAFFSGISIASNPERDSLKSMSVPGFNGTTSTMTAPIIEPTLQTANISSPNTTVDTRPTVETMSNSTAAPPTSFQNDSTRTTVEQPVSNGTSQTTRSTSTWSTATATTSTETAVPGTSTSSNTTAQTTHATINDTSVSHTTVNTPATTAVPQTMNATTWMPETVNGTQSFRLDYSEKTLTILFSVVFGVIVLGMVTYVFHKCKQKIQYLHQPLYNTEEDTVDGFVADDDTLVISGGLYDGHQVYDNPPTATVDQAQFRLEFLTEGSS